MQLTAGSMTVEFRPHSILSEKFVYTLSLKNKWGEVSAMSMRLMTKREHGRPRRKRFVVSPGVDFTLFQ